MIVPNWREVLLRYQEEQHEACNMFEYIEETKDCFGYEPEPCSAPTDYKPGTAEKIQVFCDRLERGEELFHDDDYMIAATIEESELMKQWIQERVAVRYVKKKPGKPAPKSSPRKATG